MPAGARCRARPGRSTRRAAPGAAGRRRGSARRPSSAPARTQQRAVGALGVDPVEPVQDPGRAVDAEAALARAHPQPQGAADVVEARSWRAGGSPPRAGGATISSHSHTSWSSSRCSSRCAEPVADVVVARASSEPGSASVAVVHGRSSPSWRQTASTVSCAISRIGRQLAAGDREEAARRRRALVVEQRVCARDVARGGRRPSFAVLEQRPHAGPDAQRARLLEAGHEPLAVLEHRVDLVLVDRSGRPGSSTCDVGRPDHADRPDRHDDVAVGRHLAAVDHGVHQPVVHRDHDPLARHHVDALDAGHVRDLAGPGAGRADGHARPRCRARRRCA